MKTKVTGNCNTKNGRHDVALRDAEIQFQPERERERVEYCIVFDFDFDLLLHKPTIRTRA